LSRQQLSRGRLFAGRLLLSSLLIAASVLISTAAHADDARIRVIDGDTLAVGATTYRLFGVDALESKQTCTATSGVIWKCGASATEALRALIGTSPVECDARERDRYGRTVATCRTAETDLGEAMVAGGWALAYRAYSKQYAPAEDIARATAAGVWSSRFVMPDEWRKGRR
jgi:endonuclease YncB( thermonuclease family)